MTLVAGPSTHTGALATEHRLSPARLGHWLFQVSAAVNVAARRVVRVPELLTLGGLLVFFARTYGGHLMARLDALDGAADGRLRLSRLRKPPWWPPRWPSWGPAAAHRSDSEETSR